MLSNIADYLHPPAPLQDMGSVGGQWIAAALIPAAIITVLFFFDHNVSAQLAQQAGMGGVGRSAGQLVAPLSQQAQQPAV